MSRSRINPVPEVPKASAAAQQDFQQEILNKVKRKLERGAAKTEFSDRLEAAAMAAGGNHGGVPRQRTKLHARRPQHWTRAQAIAITITASTRKTSTNTKAKTSIDISTKRQKERTRSTTKRRNRIIVVAIRIHLAMVLAVPHPERGNVMQPWNPQTAAPPLASDPNKTRTLVRNDRRKWLEGLLHR